MKRTLIITMVATMVLAAAAPAYAGARTPAQNQESNMAGPAGTTEAGEQVTAREQLRTYVGEECVPVQEQVQSQIQTKTYAGAAPEDAILAQDRIRLMDETGDGVPDRVRDGSDTEDPLATASARLAGFLGCFKERLMHLLGRD